MGIQDGVFCGVEGGAFQESSGRTATRYQQLSRSESGISLFTSSYRASLD
jgi:hypothetical protein